MTIEEKAKILDSIIAEHGGYAEGLVTINRPCECDASVGWICEYCTEHAILAKIASVSKIYKTEISIPYVMGKFAKVVVPDDLPAFFALRKGEWCWGDIFVKELHMYPRELRICAAVAESWFRKKAEHRKKAIYINNYVWEGYLKNAEEWSKLTQELED